MTQPLPAGAGFIGLGQIGKPMAKRLADWPAGLWVCDVDPRATGSLERAGAAVVATPRDVAQHAGVVSVMVRDDQQVRTVVEGSDGILAGAAEGTVIVVHSTIHPDTAKALAVTAAARGVEVIDAPVSGGALGARDGRLAVMVGGSDQAFAAARGLLDRLGEMVVHVGPVGAGTRAKLARNLLHFVSFTATTEAQRLAEAAGIDLQILGQIVRHTDAITGGAGAIMLRDSTKPIPEGDNWYPIFDGVRALGEKDLRLAIELADELGVATPLARIALTDLGPGLGLAPTAKESA